MYSTDQHISPKNHKVQVASNACYDLLYDEARNRVYFTICGFWKNKECVPDFFIDWDKTLSLVQPGFTILTDMRTMITHPQELGMLHEEAHRMIVDAGVKKVAHVMPTDKIAYLQVLSIHERSNLPAQLFTNDVEADQWLDILATPSAN